MKSTKFAMRRCSAVSSASFSLRVSGRPELRDLLLDAFQDIGDLFRI
jgi:hypothetical protein